MCIGKELMMTMRFRKKNSSRKQRSSRLAKKITWCPDNVIGCIMIVHEKSDRTALLSLAIKSSYIAQSSVPQIRQLFPSHSNSFLRMWENMKMTSLSLFILVLAFNLRDGIGSKLINKLGSKLDTNGTLIEKNANSSTSTLTKRSCCCCPCCCCCRPCCCCCCNRCCCCCPCCGGGCCGEGCPCVKWAPCCCGWKWSPCCCKPCCCGCTGYGRRRMMRLRRRRNNEMPTATMTSSAHAMPSSSSATAQGLLPLLNCECRPAPACNESGNALHSSAAVVHETKIKFN